MPDTVERLRAALDEAQFDAHEAHHVGCYFWAEDGHCDCRVPAQRLALVERDRALLSTYEKAVNEVATAMEMTHVPPAVQPLMNTLPVRNTLRGEVERAAEFWLGRETTDADH